MKPVILAGGTGSRLWPKSRAALLEEELDLDPFQEMEDAVYPTTFGEFVSIYEKYSS